MQALIFGLAGMLLGALTAKLAPTLVRRLLLLALSIAGPVAIFLVNATIAAIASPGLAGNLSLGSGVFLLGLWYVHGAAVRVRA